ncbi:MAG: ribosome biogenesis GTP-binding protein YihA/YsxC [Rhodocyclaceae bacterium]|nr:ribosome biogenesis GTP-binding protein YihA/YsxC [Rhodocyclaceae bacterium]
MQRPAVRQISPFSGARYERSIAEVSDLSPSTAAEIAFVGRSNAGKSSALNALVGASRLAFVSKTPGRTQLINVFRLANGAALVDLPGYGFAKAPASMRRRWQALLEAYLLQRKNLVGLVLIMDARHPFTPLDRQLIEWFAPTGKPIHCLLTKADKLVFHQRLEVLAKARRFVLSEYAGLPISLQLFSSLAKMGLEEAHAVLAAWLEKREAGKEKRPPAKGEKAEGQKTSMSIEAPAQGGKAGEGSHPP